MKTLSINAGSSSLKFLAYEMPEEIELMQGYFERIGSDQSFYTLKINGEKTKVTCAINTHKEAVELLIKELLEKNIIKDLSELKGVSHRVVHGGSKYASSVEITDEVIKELEKVSELAPLHNPANIMGIKEFKKAIPKAVSVANFDTAFHQTMESDEFIYPVPYEWYEKYGVRRYGFHGISYQYIMTRVEEVTNIKNGKYIICHIGNGASMSAIQDGKCVATSMGFTPNAGLVMGTRSGDIDSTLIPYVMEKSGLSMEAVYKELNNNGGLLGVSGVSNDSRDIVEGKKNSNERCILADKLYNKRIVEYIAKYHVLLNGADAIIFTAGVGENAYEVREDVIKRLAILGIKLDNDLNKLRGQETAITTKDSAVPCYVIPTNEELMMAKEVMKFIK